MARPRSNLLVSSFRWSLAVLAALLVQTSCGVGKPGRPAPDGEDAGWVRLEVENTYAIAVEVYWIDGRSTHRLGTVGGLSNATLRFPRDWTHGNAIRFGVQPRRALSSMSVVDFGWQLTPDEDLTLRIPGDLRNARLLALPRH